MSIDYVSSTLGYSSLQGYTVKVDPEPFHIPLSNSIGKLHHRFRFELEKKLDERYRPTGILLPAYLYPENMDDPESDFNKLINWVKEYKKIPFYIILNPEDGPGTEVIEDYTLAVRRLRAAGAQVLGYVYTLYGERPLQDVFSDIDKWIQFYPETNGIFLDETPDTFDWIPHYKQIADYIYNVKGLEYIVLNPGTYVEKEWLESGCGDYYVVYESDGYPALTYLRGDLEEDDGFMETLYKKRAILCYETSYSSSDIVNLQKYSGLLYVTDDVLDNPWDTICSYFEDVLNLLKGRNFIQLYNALTLLGRAPSSSDVGGTVVVRDGDSNIVSKTLQLSPLEWQLSNAIEMEYPQSIPNLNVELVDGFHTSTTSQMNSSPISTSGGIIDVSYFELDTKQPYVITIDTSSKFWFGNTYSTYYFTGESDYWSTSSSLNTARYNLAAAGTKNASIAFGGTTTAESDITEKFNGGSWSNTGNLNSPRMLHAGAGLQDAGLVFGGYYDSNTVSQCETFNGNAWSVSASMVYPRGELAGCGLQNSALAFGSFPPPDVAPSEKFDGTSWSVSAYLVAPRFLLAGCGLQGAALAFGGLTTSDPGVSITEKFDGSIWSLSANLTLERYYLAGCGLQGAALAFGGYRYMPPGENITEKFNGNSWFTTVNTLTKRYGLAGAGTQLDGLGVGGYDGNNPLGVTEIFNGNESEAIQIKESVCVVNNVESTLLYPATQNAWVATGALNTAKRDLAGCGTQNAALSFGGSTGTTYPTQVASATCEKFNSSAWSVTSSLGTARYGLGGCGVQNAAITFSGAASGTDPGTTKYTVTETFNGQTWSTTVSMNRGRSLLGGVGIQNAAIAYGGYSSLYQYYDTSTEVFNGVTWSFLGALNQPGMWASGCGTRNAALSFSRYTGSYYNTAEKYNGVTWTTTGTIVTSRYAMAGSGTQNAGLGFGGWTTRALNVTEKFNGQVWSGTGALLTGRAAHAGCGLQNSTLAFAGATASNTITTNTEKFNYRVRSFLFTTVKQNTIDNTNPLRFEVLESSKSTILLSTDLSSHIVVEVCMEQGFDNTTYPSILDVYEWAVGPSLNVAKVGSAGSGITSSALNFGGLISLSENTTNTEVFDNIAWSLGPAMVAGVHNLGGCGTVNATLALGGFDGQSYSSLTQKFNGLAWGVGSYFVNDRSALGCAGTYNALIIFGGYQGYTPGLSTTEKFNGVAWSYCGDLTVTRFNLAGCGTQNTGLAVGGWIGSGSPLTTVEKFNGYSWFQVAVTGLAKLAQAAFGSQLHAVVFGGYNTLVTDTSERFNGLTWTQSARLSVARSALSGAGAQVTGLAFTGWLDSLQSVSVCERMQVSFSEETSDSKTGLLYVSVIV